MADKKISALTALAQGDVVVSTDVLPIVDTSATETKKIAVNALVGAAAAAGLTNVDINSGTIDGATIATSDITVGAGKTLNVSAGTLTLADNQISGDKVEGGTINAITINTLTSTAVNATTVDATNVEVTNIKAKDGTAAGSIADSTGVVTLGSSVLTTTDINGGTIDGTTIGGSSAAAGTFTTLTTSSTVTLNGGTANGVLYLNGSKAATSGSALTFDGNVQQIGAGSTANTAIGLRINATNNAANGGFIASQRNGSDSWLLSDTSAAIGSGTGFVTYVYGANPAIWYTNAAERMRLDSSGNLGIGTSSPITKLDVRSDAAVVATSGYSSLHFNALPASATARAATIRKNYDSPFDFNIYASTGTSGNSAATIFYRDITNESMRLDSSGNLGIGTSSPGYKVDIVGGNIWRGTSGSTSAALYISAGQPYLGTTTNHAFSFITNDTERARITSGGNLLVGTTSNPDNRKVVIEGGPLQTSSSNTSRILINYNTDAEGFNAADAAILCGKNNSTGRSINAGGTVNASGADYAEYMEKAGDFAIAKGDVCGIDANGKLTNIYAEAMSFVVKSTNPSYVGGDTWGIDYENDAEGLEAARQKVDRIAFAGQVPVNVLGATPGQYIVPVNDNGAIKGMAVSNPTFEQYQAAVGKVIAIEDDGRARIIVKVA